MRSKMEGNRCLNLVKFQIRMADITGYLPVQGVNTCFYSTYILKYDTRALPFDNELIISSDVCG